MRVLPSPDFCTHEQMVTKHLGTSREQANSPAHFSSFALSLAGLAMTRSLGHAILSQCGISSEPEFFSTTLEYAILNGSTFPELVLMQLYACRDGDKLIIGCDGLWDVISNEEAMGIVALYAGQTPQATIDDLLACCDGDPFSLPRSSRSLGCM